MQASENLLRYDSCVLKEREIIRASLSKGWLHYLLSHSKVSWSGNAVSYSYMLEKGDLTDRLNWRVKYDLGSFR
jgi:hypothetical protein